jgi:nitroreductase
LHRIDLHWIELHSAGLPNTDLQSADLHRQICPIQIYIYLRRMANDMKTGNMATAMTLDGLIRNRRSLYPKSYNDQEITDEEIWHILENANWAPNHKKTEPWRFRVLRGNALVRLGEFLAGIYKSKTPEELYSHVKFEKMRTKTTRASCVIAIYMQRDPDEKLPEWEEIAAVSAAVQNMWLTCTAMGIGAYWSSPSAFVQTREFLEVEPGERCLGLFYMGKCDDVEQPGKRGSIRDKVRWITE